MVRSRRHVLLIVGKERCRWRAVVFKVSLGGKMSIGEGGPEAAMWIRIGRELAYRDIQEQASRRGALARIGSTIGWIVERD
jgi:hypothetical protein